MFRPQSQINTTRRLTAGSRGDQGYYLRIPVIRVQLCWHIGPVLAINEGGASSIYRSPETRWQYAQEFKDPPVVQGTPLIASGHSHGVRLSGHGTGGCNYRIYSVISGASARLMLFAIGFY